MKLIRPALAALLVLAVARSASAQQLPGSEITQVLVSRPQLESLLTQYEQAAQSNVWSGAQRELFRRRAQLVRQRLADGDFPVGDRIALSVEGETALTDTFTVQSGRQILLPVIGPVSLQGVMRYELQDYLTTRLRQYVRDPRVRAKALIRVIVEGSVGKQGFHTVAVDIPIDAVFEQASGIASTADLNKIAIRRGRETLYEGDVVLQLITEGQTLDALGIQAGDTFFIDAQPLRNPNPAQRFQALQFLIALPVSLFSLGKLLGF